MSRHSTKNRTRRIQVFEKLVDAHESGVEWVPGPELATPECGGSEGLKRMREIRKDFRDLDTGWDIEGRKRAGLDSWEYRLVKV